MINDFVKGIEKVGPNCLRDFRIRGKELRVKRKSSKTSNFKLLGTYNTKVSD